MYIMDLEMKTSCHHLIPGQSFPSEDGHNTFSAYCGKKRVCQLTESQCYVTASSLWTERFLKVIFYLRQLLLCGQATQMWAVGNYVCLLVISRLEDQNDDRHMMSLINTLPKIAFLTMRAPST